MPHKPAENTNIPESELYLRRFGKWFITPAFAFGSGVISVAACYFLPFFASLSFPFLIIILSGVFIAEFAVHVAFFKDSVPDTLVDIFINDIFEGLSPKKKILLGIGLVIALGGGLALAGLIFNSVQFILLGFSTATPLGVLIPIGGFLAIVALFAYTSLLTKYIARAIKDNLHETIARFFKEIFTRNEKIPLTQQVFEGFFQLLFLTFILLVTIIGTISLLGTMQKHLLKFFMLIPKANELACKIASFAIIYGLTGPARLPFALKSVCSIFSRLGKITGYLIYRTGLFLFEVLNNLFVNSFADARNLIAENGIAYLDDVKKGCEISDSVKIILFKLGAMIIHGLSFGALAKDAGTAVLEDTLSIPNEIAEALSGPTAVIMASTIAVYHLFPEENSKELPLIETQEKEERLDKEVVLITT